MESKVIGLSQLWPEFYRSCLIVTYLIDQNLTPSRYSISAKSCTYSVDTFDQTDHCRIISALVQHLTLEKNEWC